MKTNKNKEIKTIQGWSYSSQSNWEGYVKPGDLVDESVYNYFLDIMPPRTMSHGYLQVGEPCNYRFNQRTKKYEATYITFICVEKGIYKYCGNCFEGQTENIE